MEIKLEHREVEHCMREAKDACGRKVEQKLKGNITVVWDGMTTITGHSMAIDKE